jgi:hypothetical protein
MPAQKSLWFPLVIGLEIVLVTLYPITVVLHGGKPSPLLDLNGFRSLSSWLQAIQLFLLGALPLSMCITYRHREVPPSRNLLAFTALLFLFASADELFKFNILLDQHQLWQVIYISFGIAIPILFRRDLIRLRQSNPKAMRLVVIGIFIFVVGGFGLEIFRRYVQQRYWYQLFGQWKFYQVDSIRTAFEELGEMSGATLLLKGMMGLARQRQAQISANICAKNSGVQLPD